MADPDTLRSLIKLSKEVHKSFPVNFNLPKHGKILLRHPKIREEDIENTDAIGFEAEDEWALEMCFYEGVLEFSLCHTVEVGDEMEQRVCGPVVYIEMNDDTLGVIIEDHKKKTWCRHVLDPSNYSVRLNYICEDDKCNSIALGFFPQGYNVRKGDPLSPVDIHNGFARIQFSLGAQGHLGCKILQIDQAMFDNNLEPGIHIYKEMAFSRAFSVDAIKEWIEMKKKGKVVVKKTLKPLKLIKNKGTLASTIDIAIGKDTVALHSSKESTRGKPSRKQVKGKSSEVEMGNKEDVSKTKGKSNKVEKGNKESVSKTQGKSNKVEKGNKEGVSKTQGKSNEVDKGSNEGVSKRKRNIEVHQSAQDDVLLLESAPTSPGPDAVTLFHPTPAPKRSRGTPKNIPIVEPLASLNEEVIIIRDDGGIRDEEVAEEKHVENAQKLLADMEPYYTFGIEELFDIPVKQITPAPATMCHRMLNQKYVTEIYDSMITNPGVPPAVADVLPYDAKTHQLIQLKKMDLKTFQAYKHTMRFLAISGQHSARAATWIVNDAEKDVKLKPLAKFLSTRKSRILCAATPKPKLINLSLRSNVVNKTMDFTSSFLDRVEHARRQYEECKRPPKGKIGDNKKDVRFKEWEEMAKITMGKSQLVTMYWILFAGNDLYSFWREVCNKWLKGELLDGGGKFGAEKEANALNPGMFRCFEGDWMDSEVMGVLEKVDNGTALLKKDASYTEKCDTMEDLALTVKLLKKLKIIIIEFYQKHFGERFSSTCTWEDILSAIPSLTDSKEIRHCRIGAGDKYLKSLLKRSVSRDRIFFPQGLVFRLEHLYYKAFGGSSRKREEPYISIFTDNLMTTRDPVSLEETSPHAPLAFVDFGKKNQRQWLPCELEVLFKYIVEMPQNTTVVLVIFVAPGVLFGNIITALHKLEDVQLYLEFGSYDRGNFNTPKKILSE